MYLRILMRHYKGFDPIFFVAQQQLQNGGSEMCAISGSFLWSSLVYIHSQMWIRLWSFTSWYLKVAQWKKPFCICSHHTANLNFLFLPLCVYLFNSCPSQFLSNLESAEPMFCSEELSSLPCKNQNKSLTLIYFGENFI